MTNWFFPNFSWNSQVSIWFLSFFSLETNGKQMEEKCVGVRLSERLMGENKYQINSTNKIHLKFHSSYAHGPCMWTIFCQHRNGIDGLWIWCKIFYTLYINFEVVQLHSQIKFIQYIMVVNMIHSKNIVCTDTRQRLFIYLFNVRLSFCKIEIYLNGLPRNPYRQKI